MEDKLMKRCNHISVHIPLIGLNGHNIKSTLSTAVSGQNELRAQLNLTRVTKKKETTPERHVLVPEFKIKTHTKKVKPRTAARCFNTRPTGEKLKKGQLFHIT